MSPVRDGNAIRVARNAVAQAKKKGLIVTPRRCSRCRKSGRRIHGHHEDYTRPLDLMWLCSDCHRVRHSETGTGGKGRHRCLVCKKIIYRHVEDSGLAEEVTGGVVHTRCKPKLNDLTAVHLSLNP